MLVEDRLALHVDFTNASYKILTSASCKFRLVVRVKPGFISECEQNANAACESQAIV